MKKHKLLFALVLITSTLSAQFELCNSNTLTSLNDVYFLDENIGIAVGDSGTIIRSTDGGLNWTQLLNVDSIAFQKVKFWDNQNGIAVGSVIYTTDDGGLSWTLQDVLDNYIFYDVELFNDFEFLVSASNHQFINSASQSAVVKLKLLEDQLIVLSEDTLEYGITQMSFVNDSLGFAHHFFGSAVSSILTTNDGGDNWNELIFESGEDFTLIEDINFISDKIGFKGGWYNPHLMRTNDGGINWQTVNIDNNGGTILDLPSLFDFHIDITTTNNLYSSGWYGEIFKSSDQGINWQKLETPVASNISLKGIFFINDSIGWAVGDYGTIIKTNNGGLLSSAINLTHSDISVYPNPFDSYINIDFTKRKNFNVKLYDLSGTLIKSTSGGTIENLDYLDSGIYMLSIQNEESISKLKVFKN